MKCCVCRRQVYRGAFVLVDLTRMECVEHLAFRILFGNPLVCCVLYNFKIFFQIQNKIVILFFIVAISSFLNFGVLRNN